MFLFYFFLLLNDVFCCCFSNVLYSQSCFALDRVYRLVLPVSCSPSLWPGGAVRPLSLPQAHADWPVLWVRWSHPLQPAYVYLSSTRRLLPCACFMRLWMKASSMPLRWMVWIGWLLGMLAGCLTWVGGSCRFADWRSYARLLVFVLVYDWLSCLSGLRLAFCSRLSAIPTVWRSLWTPLSECLAFHVNGTCRTGSM